MVDKTAQDTVAALSSGRLPSGIAVIRLSGPKTRFVIETITNAVPPPRMATLTTLRQGDGSILDAGLTMFFPAPHSFTGEDAGEFHVHGGKAVVAALLARITEFDRVRHAEPGEFTQRAFLNGKLDLASAEGLADLIAAETEAQRRFAIQNSQGAQSALYMGWRARLIHARAMIEAEMDFSEEADIPGSVASTIWADIAEMRHEIASHVSAFHRAEIIRDGYDVVILGAPNAGKSSLLNALAQRDVAIVTDEPGTTRDLVEIVLDIHGMKIRVTDTAGIRTAGGRVEAIGIERALARARSAELILYLMDLVKPEEIEGLPPEIPTLRIGAKQDLLGDATRGKLGPECGVVLSALTGEGVDGLIAEIGRRAALVLGSAGDVLPSRERHVGLLRECLAYLEGAAISGAPLELRCEDLRLAGDRLGRIVGAIDVEDMLDVIFSQFCIGK